MEKLSSKHDEQKDGLVLAINELIKDCSRQVFKSKAPEQTALLNQLYNLKDLIVLNLRDYQLDKELIEQETKRILLKLKSFSQRETLYKKLVSLAYLKSHYYRYANTTAQAEGLQELRADLDELVTNGKTSFDYTNRYSTTVYGVAWKYAAAQDADPSRDEFQALGRNGTFRLSVKQRGEDNLTLIIRPDGIRLEGSALGTTIDMQFSQAENSVSHAKARQLRAANTFAKSKSDRLDAAAMLKGLAVPQDIENLQNPADNKNAEL